MGWDLRQHLGVYPFATVISGSIVDFCVWAALLLLSFCAEDFRSFVSMNNSANELNAMKKTRCETVYESCSVALHAFKYAAIMLFCLHSSSLFRISSTILLVCSFWAAFQHSECTDFLCTEFTFFSFFAPFSTVFRLVYTVPSVSCVCMQLP